MTGQLHVCNALGMRLSVDVESEQDALTQMRSLGRSGWGPLEVPAGGFRLPLALHDRFDWSLIGAFSLEIEGEHGVMFRGQFYKQRVYEEETKGKKLPARIKYSRGASKLEKAMGIAESGQGDDGYITLMSFGGRGKSISQYEVPRGEPAQERHQSAPPLRGEALADAQSRGDAPGAEPILERQAGSIVKLCGLHGIDEKTLEGIVRKVTRRTGNYQHTTAQEAAQVIKEMSYVAKAGAA